MVAAFLALIAIGSGVEIMDPAIGAFARNEPIVAALVTGLACPFSLWIAMRRLPPLTIDAAGITYPRAWQGTIPWRQIVAARIGPFAGQSSVILTVDPGSANPLLPGFRRITQRQSFADADRPILTGFLDVEAADLLERIEQERRRS
jgi:hypothetical protein